MVRLLEANPGCARVCVRAAALGTLISAAKYDIGAPTFLTSMGAAYACGAQCAVLAYFACHLASMSVCERVCRSGVELFLSVCERLRACSSV